MTVEIPVLTDIKSGDDSVTASLLEGNDSGPEVLILLSDVIAVFFFF